MQRIPAIQPEAATGAAKSLFEAIKSKTGGVPNILRTMGHSTAALEAYLAFNEALSKGALTAAEREQIALACAGANGCDYCASAHTALGRSAGLSEAETKRNLIGDASDPKARALVAFVRHAVKERAVVSDSDLQALRDVGYTDAHIVEVVAAIAANIFTNYFNHIAATDVDFPLVATETVRLRQA